MAELPSIDNLRCFIAAAQTLNFRAAARAVFLTPAALGQRIKQLEEQLGVKLFHRTTRSVALSAAGLGLLPTAQSVVAGAAECIRAARGETKPAPIELVLGTRHELGMSWLMPQTDRLAKRHPELTLHLYFGSGEDLLLRIQTREIDCAITSTRFNNPKLDSARLHREDYVFVGSDALLRRAPLTRMEHAARHTLIDIADGLPLFRYWRDAPGGSDRLRFPRVLRVGTIGAIEQFVLAGRGVAVLPHYLVEPALQRSKLRRIFPNVSPLSDFFRLVFRADDPRAPVYQALAATLLEAPLR